MHLEGEPIAQVDNTAITYLHTDHLATPRKATNEAGQVVWQWESEAFGNALPQSSGIAVNLRLPGQYYDAETGLYYNYWRYYEVGTGRYVSSDPIGLNGGVNTYGYAYQSPVNYYDPDGRLVWFLFWGGASFIWQMHQNGNRIECVDYADVAIATILGGFGPAAKPFFKSVKKGYQSYKRASKAKKVKTQRKQRNKVKKWAKRGAAGGAAIMAWEGFEQVMQKYSDYVPADNQETDECDDPCKK